MPSIARATPTSGARFGLVFELIRRSVELDVAAVRPLIAVRPAIGLAVPIAVGAAFGHPIVGVSIGAGALVAGAASVNGSFEPPVLMVALVSLVTGVTTFVGSATGAALWLHLVLSALLGFVAGLTVPLGRVPSQVATVAAIAFLVFGRFPLDVPHALEQGGYVAAGGLLQTVLAAVVRIPGRFRGERAALAATFEALAAFARQIPAGATALAAGAAAADAEAMLTRSWADPDSDAYAVFRALLSGARRMRLELSALQQARASLEDTASLDAWLGEAAAVAEQFADALRHGDPARATLREPPPTDWLAATAGAALAGQFRAAARLIDRQHVARRGRLRLPQDAAEAIPMVRANLTLHSTAFRHALRLAVALPVAVLVAHELAARRGYWVPLTTLLLLRPDFAATVTRGLARFGGTVVGVTLATLLTDWLHPRGALLVGLVAVLGYGAFATFRVGYALYSVFIAALVVFLVSVATPDSSGLAADRLVDTVLGGLVAVLGYLLWPTWEGSRLDAQLLALLRTQGSYLSAVLRGLAGAPVDDAVTARCADEARAARTNVEAALERAEGEPRRFSGDLGAARDVLTQSRLAVRAGHALHTVGEHGATRMPCLAEFARAVDEASARFGTGQFPDLRAAHARLGAGYDDASREIVADTDLLVDAFDTIHGIIARHRRATPRRE